MKSIVLLFSLLFANYSLASTVVLSCSGNQHVEVNASSFLGHVMLPKSKWAENRIYDQYIEPVKFNIIIMKEKVRVRDDKGRIDYSISNLDYTGLK